MQNSFLNKLIATLKSPGRIVFLPLFWSLYVVRHYFNQINFPLADFKGRSVSRATYEGIDIAARVGNYYNGLLLGILLFFIFLFVVQKLLPFIKGDGLSLLNGIALAGSCLMPFALFGADLESSLHLVIALQLVVVITCLPKFSPLTILDFISAILFVVPLFFIQYQLSAFFFPSHFVSLPIAIVLGATIYLFFQKKLPVGFHHSLKYWSWIPLLSFFAIELAYIFNQHSVFIPSVLLYVIGLGVIGVLIIRSLRKNKSTVDLGFYFRHCFPGIIAAIMLLALYQPVVHPEVDWFEDANRILPLHQWMNFGRIPFLETFNSHALSDFFFGGLYSIFNGMDPAGGYVYGFLMKVIVVLIWYFLLLKITGNGFLAIWLSLFYPYAEFLLPPYYNIVPLAVLLFISMIENPSRRNVFAFNVFLICIVVWRIDLGISTVTAGVIAALLFWIIMPSFQPKWSEVMKGKISALIFGFALFLLAFILSGKHLFVSMKDALNYLSSFQSYGIKDLANSYDIKYFSLYFLLPVAVFSMFGYACYGLATGKHSGTKGRLSIAIVFFSLFYLSNLQRGLVRHTLAEQWDTAITSFGFIIVASAVLYANYSERKKFLLFYLVSTVVLINYMYAAPELNYTNRYSTFNAKIKSGISFPVGHEKLNRIVYNPSEKNKYSELDQWLTSNLTLDQTFIDFSNTGMMYYFTNRQLPNYLCQIPHTAHNDYLQNRFLEDLKKYDAPVVLFSNQPKGFWDYLDGIPNTLRHYRISEFIFRNYSPDIIVSDHTLWKKNDRKNTPLNSHTIMYLSFYGMSLQNATIKDSTTITTSLVEGFTSWQRPIKESGKIYFEGKVQAQNSGMITFQWITEQNGERKLNKSELKLNPGKNNLFVALGDGLTIDQFGISFSGNNTFQSSGFFIKSSDFYPDLVSAQPQEDHLKWIPLMWGSFDEHAKTGMLEKQKEIFSGEKIIRANEEVLTTTGNVVDRVNGNYIHLKAKLKSDKDAEVMLNYGGDYVRNGGFVYSLKADGQSHDYLIRISSQYNWWAKQNNWISIQSVGTDLTVEQFEILKGD